MMDTPFCEACGKKTTLRKTPVGFDLDTGEREYVETFRCHQSRLGRWFTPHPEYAYIQGRWELRDKWEVVN